jgi:two-component system, cell cycle sensor histidine kinase and response regulator CckA
MQRGDVMIASVAPTTGIALRIFYIDDDAELALLFKRWLERSGHRVSTECSPRAAIDMVCDQPGGYDLVVTDYQMPELNGIEVARAIQMRCPGLRCEVVSSHVTGDLAESALRAGVGTVFQKPFTPRDYDNLVTRWSRNQIASREGAGIG